VPCHLDLGADHGAKDSSQHGRTLKISKIALVANILSDQMILDDRRRAALMLGQLVEPHSNDLMSDKDKVARRCTSGALSILRKDQW
jgi:hypothetical protein